MSEPQGQATVTISGVWLRRVGDYAVVLVERDGQWIEVIRERVDNNFSHIVEPNGIRHISHGRTP